MSIATASFEISVDPWSQKAPVTETPMSTAAFTAGLDSIFVNREAEFAAKARLTAAREAAVNAYINATAGFRDNDYEACGPAFRLYTDAIMDAKQEYEAFLADQPIYG